MGFKVDQELMLERFRKDVGALTPEDRQFLQDLNEKLMLLEAKIKAEAQKMLEFGAQRAKETDLCGDCIEVEYKVRFFISENDPASSEEQDDILARLWGNFQSDEDWEFGVADGQNHNEFQYQADHPMKDEFHCWLYHELYHHVSLDLPDGRRHVDLDWGNLLRIDQIGVDVKLWFQNWNVCR